MNVPVPASLKDREGRFIAAALFDWELTAELLTTDDDARREALQCELTYRGLSLSTTLKRKEDTDTPTSGDN